MQVKTRGIVLHSVKYNDSSTILTVFTQEFGRVSYMVYGVNKKKSVLRTALLQPLSVLSLEVYHVPGKEIQRIHEAQVAYSFVDLPYNMVKNAIALFLAEVLFRALKQTEPDEIVYEFLEESIQLLDTTSEAIYNFHLIFLIRLSRFMGFEPNDELEGGRYFDLLNGVFIARPPLHTHYMPEDASAELYQLLQCDFDTMDQLVLSRKKRNELLDYIIEYYRLHLPEFHGVHSLEVLTSLFD